jgi:hypothetical protein
MNGWDPILEKVEVFCDRCQKWYRYQDLETDFVTSPSVGWRKTYHCPQCGKQIGSSHGPDFPYGIYSAYFEELILEALARGEDWVRIREEQ